MNNLNSVLIEGELVEDPKLGYLPPPPVRTAFCLLSIVSSRTFKKETGLEKEVSYFEVETWGKLAEACYSKAKKGRGVRVVGRLKQERWEEDGKSYSKVLIVAEHIEFRPEFKKTNKEKETVNERTEN